MASHDQISGEVGIQATTQKTAMYSFCICLAVQAKIISHPTMSLLSSSIAYTYDNTVLCYTQKNRGLIQTLLLWKPVVNNNNNNNNNMTLML
jgi:Ca2+-dependent lipid-binding protein